jgi:aminopeptidase N
VKQTQKGPLYQIPVTIDIYLGSAKKRHQVWLKSSVDTFSFAVSGQPDLINFDGDKIFLCTKKENKTLEQYIHQYKYAGLYLDRREAIEFISKKQDDPKVIEFMALALKDKYSGLRSLAISKLDSKKAKMMETAQPLLLEIARKDPSRVTKSRAVEVLGNLKKPEWKPLFSELIQDSSYTVSGVALIALSKLDEPQALAEAKLLAKTKTKGNLQESVATLLIKSGDESLFEEVASAYSQMGLSQAKFNLTATFANFLGVIRNTEKVKKGVDEIVKFRDAIPEQFGIWPVIDNMLKTIIGKKEAAKKEGGDIAPLQEQIDYIKSKLTN